MPSPRRERSKEPPKRIVIQYPAPAVDGGRYPVKRCTGDTVHVSADVFRDGHDKLRAVVRFRRCGEQRWRERPMTHLDPHVNGVRWGGSFSVDEIGRWEYTVAAWSDVFGTWRDELARKVNAGQQDLSGELSEGVVLLRAAVERASAAGARRLIAHALSELENPDVPEGVKHDIALGHELFEAVEGEQERYGCVMLEPLPLEVDRLRARFSSWYELFPRSFGGLKGVGAQLPRLAELGFDVLYLPPIHPIGVTNRKGRNNALTAGPEDPGSPWAIGKLGEGGHEAVHLELGTRDDVKDLCARAREFGIDVALDLAIQCSADHPWLTEHPEWFHRRPDGTLKYAENPPKRYQDIYNVNWDTPDWKALWEALLEITLGWVELGVKVFRVDNPHTKPFAFWEWLIAQVHERDREIIFLAEAFTRRSVMRHLAKIGFSQSYTYFTWKNARWELVDYVVELITSGEQEYFRPNFFANTPDILHEYLQHGGRPAFQARLALAATLSPAYGIYSGYENFENAAAHAGSEEYLHSEKYEVKQRSLDGELLPMVQTLNHARRANPALQDFANLNFIDCANDSLIGYAKQSAGNTVLTIVNLDPHSPQEGQATVPAHLGLPPAFTVHDVLTGARWQWRIGPNYVRLVPGEAQAHVLAVEA